MRKLHLKKSPATLSLFLLCLLPTSARLNAQEAYKIDDINKPRCDLSEVPPLDPAPGGKFATTLQNTPDARGAIVVYGLQGYAARFAKNVKERLVNFAGVAAQRLVTIYGGQTEDSRLELWIIPKGAAEPRFDFAIVQSEPQQFDTYSYLRGEYCGPSRPPALVEFAEALKRRRGWHGYIVVRPHRNRGGVRAGDEDWDPDGYLSRREAARRAANDKHYLVRKFGLAPARLQTLVGDNDDWTHAELWLVPPGAELPVSKIQSSMKKR
jgi:hypothetical protein